MDKYGLEIQNCDHIFASALRENGMYSFKELERRFAGLKPPFKFVEEAEDAEYSQEDEYLEDI